MLLVLRPCFRVASCCAVLLVPMQAEDAFSGVPVAWPALAPPGPTLQGIFAPDYRQ